MVEQFNSFSSPPASAQSVSSPSHEQSDTIKEVMVKVLIGKEEKTFVLRDVHLREMAPMDRLKLYLESVLPNVTLGDIRYYQKRKKVWLQSQFDLQTVVKEQLSKGKGGLWCSMDKPAVVEQHSEACDSEEVPDIPPTSSAKRKKSLVEEKRERVQGIFEDLKGLHQTKYTAPQYRLWAEAINIGQHVSRETPPLGTMFQRCGANPVLSSKNELSEAFTELAKSVSSAIGGKRTPPNQSPPKEHRSITPAKAAALKTTYINQIKDLHDLFESGAISEADYLKQQDIVLMQMANL